MGDKMRRLAAVLGMAGALLLGAAGCNNSCASGASTAIFCQ